MRDHISAQKREGWVRRGGKRSSGAEHPTGRGRHEEKQLKHREPRKKKKERND